MKDYYRTLGVERTASADEIKRAYRKLASQHHPDRGGDTARFQEIEEAYRILSDPQQRQQYDNPQPDFSQFGFRAGAPFDFDSIFDIFGTQFRQGAPRRSVARMSLWIQLTDVATGGSRTVSVGTNQGVQAIEINIPLGIEDGQAVQYSGLAPGGGDLVITFRVHPHPQYQRQGSNLVTEQTVNIWDLILGGELQVRDLLGNWLSMNIPPRTQPGTVLRLRGRGLPQRTTPAGDLLVRVQAQIPTDIPQSLLDQIAQNHKK